MFSILRTNTPYSAFILFIYALLANIKTLIHPQLPSAVEGLELYNLLLRGFLFIGGNSAFVLTLFSIILVYVQALYLNYVVARHRLFSTATYIPAFLFLSVAVVNPNFIYLSPTCFVNFCMIAALNSFLNLAQSNLPRKYIFNAGFFVALSGIFQFSALLYLLLFFFALLILRPFNTAEWVVGLLGLFTPFYFYFSLLFLADNLLSIGDWADVGFSLPKNLHNALYFFGSIGILSTLVFAGLYVLQEQMQKSTIFVRRSWNVIAAFFCISLLVAVFSDASYAAAWAVNLASIALLCTHPYLTEKPKWLRLGVQYLTIAMVVFVQFF